MQYFYIQYRPGQGWFLAEPELGHCYRVLRHRAGDEVPAVDGSGHRFRIRLGGQGEAVEVLAQQADPAEHYGEVALMFPLLKKRESIEWLVEKATELGATALHPVRTERCERRDLGAERLERILLAAMKQCGRSRMPQLHPLKSFTHFIAGPLPDLCFLPHLEAAQPLAAHRQALATRDVLFAIGPEGDFSPAEVRAAEAVGFRSVRMGQHRLRAETAAAYALSVIKTEKGY
ncbi:MAG: 16S rRNA (uracil(1498)-N(3))-methyltransferase [Bacteroidetes bacterium]|jgi:16S rRNA (uracil1498-N3)-methyltransferase|nr:16S rRNA (uracil(1498)-N(3))-methyltransferase [Bacteroidota bacterium]